MSFAPYAVHAPIMANERLLGHYPDLDEREAAYATMVESVEQRPSATCWTCSMSWASPTDTVVIYTSDNGGLSAPRPRRRARRPDPTHPQRPAPLRQGSAYEGGTRVPMVVDWPRVTPGASTCSEPVVGTDLFPTILAIAGAPIPDAYDASVDGDDLVPLFRGEETLGKPRVLGWNQPHQWGASGPGYGPSPRSASAT